MRLAAVVALVLLAGAAGCLGKGKPVGPRLPDGSIDRAEIGRAHV